MRFLLLLIWSELRRFFHNGFFLSIFLPLGIGILVQIAVPEQMSINDPTFERRVFYSIIFCFWMGITNASRRIVGERRVIDRLRIGGASALSIFISKLAVVLFAATLHSAGFFGTFIFNIVDISTTSPITARINALRYGHENMLQWADRDSEWHAKNDDPFSEERDSHYGRKVDIGIRYSSGMTNEVTFLPCSFEGSRQLSQFKLLPGVLFALFLASAAAGILGLLLSAYFKDGQTDKVLLCVPFVTAYQIMYAKITTGGGSALFGELREVGAVFEWYSLYHLFSFGSYSRYLTIIASRLSWSEAVLSSDALVVYSFSRNRSRRLFSHGPVRRLQNRVGIDTRQSQHLET
jgi:hypothetical protein